MNIIYRNEIELKDVYEKNIKYIINIVDSEDSNFPPIEVLPEGYKLTMGYKFILDDDKVTIFLNYSEVTPGKCALLSYLISKTEIESLTNALWNEYAKVLDMELMDEIKRSNMSETFFNQLTYKNNEEK
jgi:hypothetical protein